MAKLFRFQLWLCIMGSTLTVQAEDLYTLTSANVRAAASGSGKVLGKLNAGAPLKGTVKKGDWVEFDYQDQRAFVHRDLVNASYFPMPGFENLFSVDLSKEWIAAYQPEQKSMAVLSDIGNQGAVACDWLVLSVLDCRTNNILGSIELPNEIEVQQRGDFREFAKNEKEKIERMLTFAWNNNGIAIQGLLRKHGFKSPLPAGQSLIRRISTQDAGLELRYIKKEFNDEKFDSLVSIHRQGEVVWTETMGDGDKEGRKHTSIKLDSIHQIGEDLIFIRLSFKELFSEGEGDERGMTLWIELSKLRRSP